MEKYKECAMQYFREGYTCTQAVVLAFHENVGMDKETALKVSSSFGGGMGRLREVCGAVSGMFMIVGMKHGFVDPKDTMAKNEHYNLIQKMANDFKDKNGSIVCRKLLGLSNKCDSCEPAIRDEKYYKKRPCVELVGDAAEIVCKYLNI